MTLKGELQGCGYSEQLATILAEVIAGVKDPAALSDVVSGSLLVETTTVVHLVQSGKPVRAAVTEARGQTKKVAAVVAPVQRQVSKAQVVAAKTVDAQKAKAAAPPSAKADGQHKAMQKKKKPRAPGDSFLSGVSGWVIAVVALLLIIAMRGRAANG